MEGFLLESWIEENRPHFVGSRISGLTIDATMRMRIDLGRVIGCLQVELNPGEVCCFIDKQVYFKPSSRPSSPFESSLGEAILDAIVSRVTKVSEDRILEWQLDSRHGPLWLVMELLPQSPNLFLLDNRRQVLGYLAEDRDRRRALRVAAEYRPPWPDRRLPLSNGLALSCPAGVPFFQWLLKHCSGISPLLALELTCRCQSDPSAIEAALHAFRCEPVAPRIYANRSLPPDDWREFSPWRELIVSPVRLLSQEGRIQKPFTSVNAAMASFATIAEKARWFTTQRNYAQAKLRSQLRRENRCFQAAREDLQHISDPDYYRNCGTLLLASATALQQQLPIANAGVPELQIEVVDYHHPDMRAVHICVDPHKSAQENAQDYFRRYRKAKRGLAVQASRVARLEQAAETSDQQLRELEQAPDPQTLQRCLEKLPRQLKLLARPGSRCVHMAQRRARGAYLSTDGLEILVGQSAMHNEELTFKFARPQDLWLHAADYAGSHVIVRNPARREVPRRTVIEAAQLAAYFSGARAEGAADVRYTLCKYVQKVKGAAAGQVRLQRFNTIRVAPQKSVGKAGRNHLPPPDKCSYV